MSRRGWALFLTMSVIWGIPYLLIKVAVDEVSPVVVVFARCVVGAVILLPWTIAKGQLRPALRHWRALLLFTVLEMAGPWLLLSYAEQSLSSSLTGLLVAAVPFVAALAARLAGEEERLTPVRLLGMGIGVVGIAALLGLDVGGAQLLPILAVALTVIGYATGPLVISRSLPDVPGVAASSIALFVTAVVYAPFAVPRLDEIADASPSAVALPGRPRCHLHRAGAGALLRAHPRGGAAARAGDHVRQPRGRRAAGRRCCWASRSPSASPSACPWSSSAACWPRGAARCGPSPPSSATSTRRCRDCRTRPLASSS